MCDKCDNKELRKELEAVTLERDLLRKQVEELSKTIGDLMVEHDGLCQSAERKMQMCEIAGIQKEKDELAEVLGCDGSLDVLMSRATKELRRFRKLQTKLDSTLLHLLDSLHESIDTSSAEEIKDACELIIRVQAMDSGERDTIMAAFRNGPLFDGDVPSKMARDILITDGFIAKVVVRGEDGFNGCTHKGAWAYRLLEAGA